MPQKFIDSKYAPILLGALNSYINEYELTDHYFQLSEKIVQDVFSLMEVRHLKKKQSLERSEVFKKAFLVVQGALRTYSLEEGGHNERTYCLTIKGQVGGAWNNIYLNKPKQSRYVSIEATTKSTIVIYDVERVEELMKKNTFYEVLYLKLVTRIVAENLYSLEKIYNHGAKKGLEVLTRNPSYANIPKKYIASYLGITPEALSRIFKKSKE